MFGLRSYRSPKTKNTPVAQNSKMSTDKFSEFFGSPLFKVLLMVTLILGISGVFRFLEWRKLNSQTQIQVSDFENLSTDDKTRTTQSRQPANIFDGEVIDTSRRLREIGALGFAVCLSILDEAKRHNQIPGTIDALLNAVSSRDLMPPGLNLQMGEIHSKTGKINIRYQAQPLRLELVSVPDQERFGPALMLRFPLISDGGKNIVYFQSAKVSKINLPKAFAPESEIIENGWTREVWRGIEMGGNPQDFAKMLGEENENLRSIAPHNSDSER